MPRPATYSRMQVGLHWIVVLLLAAQYLLHERIEDAWEARLDGTLPNEPFVNPHTVIGLLILVLAVWRIVLRLRRAAPAPPENEARAMKALASGAHLAFYVLLIAMPLSGALAWVTGLELPAAAHEVAAKLLLALIALHVAGALVHAFWLKSGVMARMSPGLMFRADGAKPTRP